MPDVRFFQFLQDTGNKTPIVNYKLKLHTNMGRQKKLTDTYAQSKLSAVAVSKKLPVKRKLVGVDENTKTLEAALASTVQIGHEDQFQLAKRALHTSRPSRLPGRESLIEEVHCWLSSHLVNKEPGAMYISGAPGTGKSAVVQHSVHRCENLEEGDKQLKPFNKLFINCMSVVSITTIYDDIAKLLKVNNNSKGVTLKEKLNFKLVGSTKAAKMT